MMRSRRSATLHVLAISLFGSMVVATPIPLNLGAFFAWAVVVWIWARSCWRSGRQASANAVAIIQAAGMLALLLIAAVAPVKIVDRQKSRDIILPRQVMTVAELSEPVEHGWARFYHYRISAPQGLAGQAVHFPACELTVGEFISAIEVETPLRHKFGHCGNGYTILYGGDCCFGLYFRVAKDVRGTPTR